jgi:PDZ domain
MVEDRRVRIPSNLFVRLTLLAAAVLTDCAVAMATDPLEWSPPAQMPALRERLRGPKYAARLASANDKIDPNVDQDHPPAIGIRVLKVDKGSPAELAGLQVGDVIVSADGDPLYSEGQYLADREGGANTLKIWRPHSPLNQSRHNVTFEPGEIGITLEHFWRPDVVYRNELGVDEKTDPLILAAATVLQSDPELAETAIFHAQQAGGNQQVIFFLAAAIATAEARFDDALAFGNQAITNAAADDKPIVADFLHTAALGSFRLKYALDLEKSYAFLKPLQDSDYVGMLEKTIKQFGDIPNWPDSPADEFAKLNTQDMAKRMTSTANPDEQGSGTKIAAGDIRQRDSTNFEAPDGTFNLFVLGPTGHNIQFTAHCHFQATDSKQSEWDKCVKFGLSPRGLNEQDLEIVVTDSGEIKVSGPWNPPYSCNLGPTVAKGFNVTMTAVGQRCEIDVNKMRIFYGPILSPPKTRQLRLVIQAIGIKGAVGKVVWKIDNLDPGQ